MSKKTSNTPLIQSLQLKVTRAEKESSKLRTYNHELGSELKLALVHIEELEDKLEQQVPVVSNQSLVDQNTLLVQLNVKATTELKQANTANRFLRAKLVEMNEKYVTPPPITAKSRIKEYLDKLSLKLGN